MKSFSNKSIHLFLTLMFFIIFLGLRAQNSVGDSITSFYEKAPFAYSFIFNYYSGIDGLSTTKGSLSGYKENNKLHFRLTLDSLMSASSKEYMGGDYIYNDKFFGCNYLSDFSYTNFKQNNEELEQVSGTYIPNYILIPDTFRSYFSNKKRYMLNVSRQKECLFFQITDTNLYDKGMAIMRKSVLTYTVSKKDYKVLHSTYSMEYIIEKISFHDSVEFIYDYQKKTGPEITANIRSFLPFKKITQERSVNPQDTITIFPTFTLQDVLYKPYASSKSRSKYTLIEFWYKSCLPCLKNIKKLNSIRDSLSKSLLDIVSINDMDTFDKELIMFISKFDPHYTVLFNGQELRKKLSIRTYPSTYIYNNETHRVVFYEKGTSDDYADKIIRHMKNLN